MFELRVFVDNKKLAEVLWRLDGQLAGQPVIIPVRGAKVQNGKIKATNPNGTAVDAVFAYARDTGLKAIAHRHVRAAVVAAGFSPKTSASTMDKLKSTKLLGKKRADGLYPLKPVKGQ